MLWFIIINSSITTITTIMATKKLPVKITVFGKPENIGFEDWLNIPESTFVLHKMSSQKEQIWYQIEPTNFNYYKNKLWAGVEMLESDLEQLLNSKRITVKPNPLSRGFASLNKTLKSLQ